MQHESRETRATVAYLVSINWITVADIQSSLHTRCMCRFVCLTQHCRCILWLLSFASLIARPIGQLTSTNPASTQEADEVAARGGTHFVASHIKLAEYAVFVSVDLL